MKHLLLRLREPQLFWRVPVYRTRIYYTTIGNMTRWHVVSTYLLLITYYGDTYLLIYNTMYLWFVYPFLIPFNVKYKKRITDQVNKLLRVRSRVLRSPQVSPNLYLNRYNVIPNGLLSLTLKCQWVSRLRTLRPDPYLISSYSLVLTLLTPGENLFCSFYVPPF